MKKGWIIALSILGALVLVGGIAASSLIGVYNSFTRLDEGVKAQWKQVENQLQRRNDLIPNLVETVKGYASHEKGVFTAVADARARMAGASTPGQRIEASNMMSSALSRLLVVVEQYPQLKADASFNRLMDELAGTENRLAVERKRYNDIVQEYNTKRRTFPNNLIAGMFNFGEAAYFNVPEEAKKVPKVEFGK